MNTQNINNNNIESKNGVNNSREETKVGTEVWTTIELHQEYGKRGKVVRRFFADHNVWCLDIEFEDGTKATYAEEYVTTEKPWAVVGAKCRHKYLNRDVVLTITAVGQYYGIKAESEGGKVKHCDLVRDFEPVETVTEAEGIKVGDKVRHNLTGDRVATVTGIRRVQGYKWEGEITVYRLDFGESVKGPCGMEMNGGEYQREAFTFFDEQSGKAERQEASEIKPKATDRIESRKRTIIARAKEDKQAWRLVKGCEVRVRKAYTNDSRDPKDWTYCVSWYADGQLVECENGVRLEQAAKALNDLPQWAEARKAA